MKRLLGLCLLMACTIATAGLAAGTTNPGNFGARVGIGTDISGGVAYGGQASYTLMQRQNAFELSLLAFGGSFSEDSNNGFYDYHEKTNLLAIGVMANYLFRWSMESTGPYFVGGIGFGSVGVNWTETSPGDTSLGKSLPGGGSSTSEDGAVGGMILNVGIGHRFSRTFDLRLQAPTLFVGGGDTRDSQIVPMFTLTGGWTF